MKWTSVLLLWVCVAARAQEIAIATAAGEGSTGFDGDGGLAVLARLFSPSGVASDRAGNLYIADTNNNRIRMVTPRGIITTIAGTTVTNETSSFSGDGGLATAARLARPIGVAVDINGNLYIADYLNNRIRKVSTTGIISTVVGTGGGCTTTGIGGGFSGDSGPAASAQISCPRGITVDVSGNLYIADSGNNRIRKVTPAGIISTVAGSGLGNTSGGFSGDGGPATGARLWNPSGVITDLSGNVYIADTQNRRIRKINPAGVISTVAGGEIGVLPSASLVAPHSLAIDDAGNLYVTQMSGSDVRKVTPLGIVTIFAGGGSSGDGGLAALSQLLQPTGLAIAPSGGLFIAESGSNRIRVASSAPAISGVVNAASNIGGLIAPGQFVAIYGLGLGPSAPVLAETLSKSLGNSRVTFNGQDTYLAYSSTKQLNVIVPYSVNESNLAEIQVSYNGAPGNRIVLPVARTAPGIFTANGIGTGQAVVGNENGTINSATNPASRGSIVTFFATGQGQTNPAGSDDQPQPAEKFPAPLLPYEVKIGGATVQQSDVLFLGLIYTGVLQVNVRVPLSIPAAPNTELVLRIGNNASPQGTRLPLVTVAVR